MNVVISQPMFFPWIGMFEQIRLADICVHYDDVQFSKGGVVHRVQVKAPEGIRWMTLPTGKIHLGQRIDEIRLNNEIDWRYKHLELLRRSYAQAPFCEEMIEVVTRVHEGPCEMLSDVTKASLEAACDYFGMSEETRFMESSSLNIEGKGSQRVLDIVTGLNGDVYITGHGASNYLDHLQFENEGVDVEYMDYRKTRYPQLHGEFTPFVSILDVIANVGPRGKELIHSNTVSWKQHIGTK